MQRCPGPLGCLASKQKSLTAGREAVGLMGMPHTHIISTHSLLLTHPVTPQDRLECRYRCKTVLETGNWACSASNTLGSMCGGERECLCVGGRSACEDMPRPAWVQAGRRRPQQVRLVRPCQLLASTKPCLFSRPFSWRYGTQGLAFLRLPLPLDERRLLCVEA